MLASNLSGTKGVRGTKREHFKNLPICYPFCCRCLPKLFSLRCLNYWSNPAISRAMVLSNPNGMSLPSFRDPRRSLSIVPTQTTHHLGHKTSFLRVENMWIIGAKKWTECAQKRRYAARINGNLGHLIGCKKTILAFVISYYVYVLNC